MGKCVMHEHSGTLLSQSVTQSHAVSQFRVCILHSLQWRVLRRDLVNGVNLLVGSPDVPDPDLCRPGPQKCRATPHGRGKNLGICESTKDSRAASSKKREKEAAIVGCIWRSLWIGADFARLCDKLAFKCGLRRIETVDTMAERKRSHVWSYFSSTNSQDMVCDVFGKNVLVRNLVRHPWLSHNTKHEAFMMRRTEEESTELVLQWCMQALSRYRGRKCGALSITKALLLSDT